MLQERWDELTKKLDLEMLSDDEAQELHTAFIQRHKQAKEENDRETVAILAGAMRATELQIHLAEIRNTSWWHTLLIMLGLKPTHNQIWEAERKRRKKAEQISDLSLGNFSPAASMPKERWNELCQKLELDDLSDGEARELHDAVIQRHKQAREENEAAAMESLGTAKIFTEFRIRDVTRKRREKK